MMDDYPSDYLTDKAKSLNPSATDGPADTLLPPERTVIPLFMRKNKKEKDGKRGLPAKGMAKITAEKLKPPASLGFDTLLDDEEPTLAQRLSRTPGLHPNTAILTLLGAMIVILQGFLPVTLPNAAAESGNTIATWLTGSVAPQFDVRDIEYTFQLPAALLVGGLLGPVLGVVSLSLFVLAGLLLLPVFANGGGWDYVYEPGFGYLIGMVAGAGFSGWLMSRAYTHDSPWQRAIWLYGTGAASVLTVHLVGATVLLLSTFVLAPTASYSTLWPQAANWLVHLSLEPLPYDILSTTVFLWFVRYVRLVLYPALY